MGYTSDENSATAWLRRDSDMSDVDFHDETGDQPGTVSIDVGGQVFTALVDPSISCTVERVFTTIDAACRKAGAPISFTKRELVKPVGVGVKAIGNALERLRADNRVTTERRGQRYWYHTVPERSITEQGQLGFVNVAAITSRPAPVTRLDQLGSTVHAGSTHPEGIGREPGENPEGIGREPGENPEGIGREPGENPEGIGREVEAQLATEPATEKLLNCPLCGPRAMQPTKWEGLRSAALPGRVYFCAGNQNRCSRLVHTTIGEFRAAGLPELDDAAASTLLRDRLGKPHPSPTQPALTNESRPNADRSRGGYVEEVRKLYGGRLPWETEEDA